MFSARAAAPKWPKSLITAAERVQWIPNTQKHNQQSRSPPTVSCLFCFSALTHLRPQTRPVRPESTSQIVSATWRSLETTWPPLVIRFSGDLPERGAASLFWLFLQVRRLNLESHLLTVFTVRVLLLSGNCCSWMWQSELQILYRPLDGGQTTAGIVIKLGSDFHGSQIMTFKENHISRCVVVECLWSTEGWSLQDEHQALTPAS